MFEYLEDNHIPHPLYRVTLDFSRTLDGALVQEIADALEDVSVSVFTKNLESTDGDNWVIELTTYGEPELDEIYVRLAPWHAHIARDQMKAEKLPEKDWLRHVHDNFPPVTIGRFFVYGSHYEGEKPADQVPLKIDAATAFGSGEHETTKGCILAFEELAEKHTFKNALDMGCGSGILAIAMKKIWPDIRLAAVDIDPESIVVTERHADMNGIADIATETGDGYRAAIVDARAPYDLIAANILAGPLVEMAPDLNRVLQPGGFCVLSGLLARQEKDVVAAHEAEGLTLIRSIAINDWRALVLRK